ncbi:helix-turn-helix domain-containing protein [Brucella cytisi]|uniref:helix-turn-helix domain-containing protein n=1 Tax=Brucella cytisi TaxID=407152 RepID=UPI00352829AE
MNETTGLLAFVRTVEAGTFSAAARLLKTSPSAVSRSVARLETLIQTRLFLRSTIHFLSDCLRYFVSSIWPVTT